MRSTVAPRKHSRSSTLFREGGKIALCLGAIALAFFVGRREPPLLSWGEVLMPWLLVLVPLAAAAVRPVKGRTRLTRAVEAFGCVLVLGLVMEVGKIFLSADIAHDRAEQVRKFGIEKFLHANGAGDIERKQQGR